MKISSNHWLQCVKRTKIQVAKMEVTVKRVKNKTCVRYSSDCVRREVKSIKYDSITKWQNWDEICLGWM